MARTVADIDVLQEYVAGVMGRADHHAHGVREIALAVAGAIVWRKEGSMKVMEHNGDMKNALWFEVGEDRYAVSYNHQADAIEVRDGTIRGDVLKAFTNETPLSEVREFFASL